MEHELGAEIWKDIKGFEGIYQISTNGRVRSFKETQGGRILSNKNSKGGYLSIVLKRKGLVISTRIHRLVAEAFIPNPDNKPQVNHKDSNRQNNYVENLEWVTATENMKHAAKNNPEFLQGINHYNKVIRPKTILQFSLEGKLLREFLSAKEASRITGVCGRNILQVASSAEYRPGKTRKQAGGFVWKFKQDKKKRGDVIGY